MRRDLRGVEVDLLGRVGHLRRGSVGDLRPARRQHQPPAPVAVHVAVGPGLGGRLDQPLLVLDRGDAVEHRLHLEHGVHGQLRPLDEGAAQVEASGTHGSPFGRRSRPMQRAWRTVWMLAGGGCRLGRTGAFGTEDRLRASPRVQQVNLPERGRRFLMASAVPDITLNNGVRSPSSGSASSRSRPRRPRTRPLSRCRWATATSTRPRCTATSARSVEAVRDSGLDRGDVFVTSKLNNGAPRLRRRPRRVRPDDGRPRTSATSTCSSSTGRCPRSATSSRRGRRWRRSPVGAGAGHRRLQLPRPTTCNRLLDETHHRAGGEPDRGPPVPRAGRRCGPSTPSTASPPRRGRRSPRAGCYDDPDDRRHRRAASGARRRR